MKRVAGFTVLLCLLVQQYASGADEKRIICQCWLL